MSSKSGKRPNAGSKPKQSGKKPTPPAAKASGNRNKLIVGGIIVAVLAGLLFVIVSNGSKGSAGSGGGGQSASNVPADEAKYLGRLLPANYQEPQVAKTTIYTSTVKATKVSATDAGTALTIPIDQITSKKIVMFDYAKPGSDPLPLLAYVKPSGKLFVGVDFCPPCKGVGQRIESDVTLTCETCGTKRQLETQIGVSGACKLYPLDEVPAKVEGGKLVVDKAALDQWSPQPLDRPTGG